ncbi:MAG: hypothetical protein Q4D13_03165 [Erysipelotrichaceae bacterium]|nr:hypothetical protein [Erysipelotrichaceae bacterium]
MKKKIVLLLLCILLTACSKTSVSYNAENINVMKDIEEKSFDFVTHSDHYLLADMSDFEVLYRHNTSDVIYPASLAKLFVLDTVLNTLDDLSGTSYIDHDEFMWLIEEDSSLAGLYVDQEYTMEDLLYALILPSGGDAALAIEDYYTRNFNVSLVDLVNERCAELGLKSSHFTNTTGLHDPDLYTCIDDIYTVVMDILTFEKGREIIGSRYHYIDSKLTVYSTTNYAGTTGMWVIGGKTGYTPESGQSIVLLYKHNYHSYLLILTNAMGGSPINREYFHYEDCFTIFDNLYYN